MAAALSPFDAVAREIVALPNGPTWIRGSLLKDLLTAILRDRARAGNGVDELPTDKGRFFNLEESGGENVPEAFPWQPYASPFTGTGSAPGNQGLKIRIRPGTVNGRPPARRNIEITVPANCTDGYWVWLKANLDARGNVTALDYDHGLTPPLNAGILSGGNLPTVVYRPLFLVTSDDTAVNDFTNVMEKTSLGLGPTPGIYDPTSQSVSYAMVWLPG